MRVLSEEIWQRLNAHTTFFLGTAVYFPQLFQLFHTIVNMFVGMRAFSQKDIQLHLSSEGINAIKIPKKVAIFMNFRVSRHMQCIILKNARLTARKCETPAAYHVFS